VINLAYLGGAPAGDNLAAAANLADVCLQAKVRRLVHCSTAVVVGRASDDVITEETQCEPDCDYELTKFKMEKLITEKARGHFDLVILRPTAVFGPGGKNLQKLADDLMAGNRGLNYLKSCLFDRRMMNLVFVDQVVSALVFLAFALQRREGDVFIVSDDEHPMNNYRDVERFLIRALGLRDYPLPRIPLPPPVLATVLRLGGRSNSNSSRTYHADKLREAGFEKEGSFEAGLASFADWYRKHHLRIRAAGNT
jgi:nucleoside-diphosphate-sugar epimerase